MPSAKQSLQSKLSLIAARHAAYYDGQSFHPIDTETSSGASVGQRILVVSRACYRETRESYPVKSVKELRGMLNQRASAGSATRTLHFIGPWQDSKRRVLSITFNPGHEEQLEQAWLIIPETILIARIFSAGFREIETPGTRLFFYQHEAAKNQHYAYQTALRGGVIQNAESARLAFGGSEEQETQRIPWRMYQNLLATGLLALPWADIRLFLVTKKTTKKPLPLSQMGISVVALVSVYLLTTSLYLNWLESSRMAQLDAYGDEVTQRLSERTQREEEITRLEALHARGVNPELVLASFELLARLQLDGVRLNEFSGDFDAVDVRGEVRSATELVTQLNQMPQVRKVEFTSPVRRGQNGEMFSLSIQLDENWRALEGAE